MKQIVWKQIVLFSVCVSALQAQSLLMHRVDLSDGAGWVIHPESRFHHPDLGVGLLLPDREAMGRDAFRGGPDNPPPMPTQFRFVAPLRPETSGEIVVKLLNLRSSETRELRIPTRETTDKADDWYGYRNALGESYQFADRYYSNPLYFWWGRHLTDGQGGHLMQRGRAPQNTANLFSILGGQAAIRETLQLQNLATDLLGDASARSVPIADIPGVEVKAHNYAELLDGKAGGHLALADLAPVDRLFLYSSRPESLPDLLTHGGTFAHTLLSMGRQGGFRRDVLERHLARFGMTPESAFTLLRSGLIEEIAVIMPDLFFEEGTDITLLLRFKMDPEGSFLRLLGPAWSPLKKDVLILSTHPGEVERIRAMETKDSLGQSEEFRYMLTQCGPDEHTKAFVYISDPFIRRLTGPEVKIGQLRRLAARADLESLAAGHLLDRMVRKAEDAAPSAKPLWLSAEQIQMENGIPRHTEYGSVARMATLLELKLDQATPEERRAYEAYRENYSRMWSQFFDPIAIALREPEEGVQELEIFILPLIDSSLYEGFRSFLATAETHETLRVPVFQKAPAAMFSMQLRDEALQEMRKNLNRNTTDFLLRNTRSIREYLGPSFHMAVEDVPPVIDFMHSLTLGAGIPMMRREDATMFLPLLSIFTRSTTLAIELADPEKVLNELRSLPSTPLLESNQNEFVHMEWVQELGEDRWLVNLNFFRTLSLRLSVEVQGEWLVIHNQPSDHRPRVTATRDSQTRSAGLTLHPGRMEGLQALYQSKALERDRRAAMSAVAFRTALSQAGFAKEEEGNAYALAAFGRTPLLPEGDEWAHVHGTPASRYFGYPGRETQPDPSHLTPVPLFPNIRDLRLFMQFEQDGLRTRVRWNR